MIKMQPCSIQNQSNWKSSKFMYKKFATKSKISTIIWRILFCFIANSRIQSDAYHKSLSFLFCFQLYHLLLIGILSKFTPFHYEFSQFSETFSYKYIWYNDNSMRIINDWEKIYIYILLYIDIDIIYQMIFRSHTNNNIRKFAWNHCACV